jgi:hypothetical protein
MDITELLAFGVKNKASDLAPIGRFAADDSCAWRRAPHQFAGNGAQGRAQPWCMTS